MRNKKRWDGLIESVQSPTSGSSLRSIMWLSQVWLGAGGGRGRGTVLFVLQVFFDGVQLLTQPTRTCHPPSAQWESTMIEKSKDTGLKVTQLWTRCNVQILSPLLTRWFPVLVLWRWRWPGDSPWYIVTRLQLPRLSWCRAPPPSHNLLVSSTLNK